MKKFDISIHALRKESDSGRRCNPTRGSGISIHALRKESDSTSARITSVNGISIHALRKESDFTFCHGFPL